MARKADNQAAPPGREQLAPLTGQLPAAAQAAADPAVALAGLATARAMAACIERAEQDLIQAARDPARPGSRSPPRWASRPGPARKNATPTCPAAGRGCQHRTPPSPRRQCNAGQDRPAGTGHRKPARPARPLARKPGTGTRHRPDPKITPAIIGNGHYNIVKAPGHAESRAWHVLVGGQRAGLVRPTWRGERTRPGWEAVTNAGTALPATGTGRVTAAGNARTRAAAAVSLLNALLREQENQPRKRTPPSPP